MGDSSVNGSCCLVLAFVFIPLEWQSEGCKGSPLDIAVSSSSCAAPSRDHGVGSRGAPCVTSPTLPCEALLNGADVGWVLRSTGQLKLHFKNYISKFHNEGKLCNSINATDTVIFLNWLFRSFKVTSWKNWQHWSLSGFVCTPPTRQRGYLLVNKWAKG